MPSQQAQAQGDSQHLRIPLATNLENRYDSDAIDARLINCIAEKVQHAGGQSELMVYKRPGLKEEFSLPAGAGRGIFNWAGSTYSVVGSTLYQNTTSLGTVDTTASYTFSAILGATPSLFLQNGTAGYYYNSTAGLTQITSGDGWPTPTIPGCAYLDGTMYVANSSANIQGSAINNLASWSTLNSIFAQIEPDQAVYLAKQLVYVVCFKQWSTEMFYDAGNSTGSPLGPVSGQKLNFGCLHAGTVADLAGAIVWVSSVREGGASVMLMDQLSAQVISTPQVDRLLQAADFTGPVYSFGARVEGHLLYILTIQNSNLTLVYDVSQKAWYEWTDANGNYLPLMGATYSGGAKTYFQHASNGQVYSMSLTNGTDNGALITSDIYTPAVDMGTRKRKMVSALQLVGDRTSGSMAQLRFSDDDYQTWSNFQQLDLSQGNPRLGRGGSFRRRAYHIRLASPVPQRVSGLELEVELCDL